MFGRVLFALVWLIIAAGVALPLYPRHVATPMVAVTTDPVQLVAGTDPSGCEDCPVADDGRGECRSDCPCGETLPAVFVPLEEPVSLAIAVTVRPQPSESSGKLPAKLPAI